MGLPQFVKGEVVKGTGKGSKKLKIPTANFPESVVENLPTDIETGSYFGYASVDKGDVHKMVASIIRPSPNKNVVQAMKTHILYNYDDFCGKELRVILLGYLRPKQDFESLNELITAIQQDIKQASEKLEESDFRTYKTHSFFKE